MPEATSARGPGSGRRRGQLGEEAAGEVRQHDVGGGEGALADRPAGDAQADAVAAGVARASPRPPAGRRRAPRPGRIRAAGRRSPAPPSRSRRRAASRRPAGDASSSRQARVVACCAVPKAMPGSTATSSSGGRAGAHGGRTQQAPRRPRPAGGTRAMASRQPSSWGSASTRAAMPAAAEPVPQPAAGRPTPSATQKSSRAVPVGRRPLAAAGPEGGAGLGQRPLRLGRRHRHDQAHQRRARDQRNAGLSRSKNPSSSR